MIKKIPWLTKEERKRMEIIRSDLSSQLGRTTDSLQVERLSRQIRTLTREIEFDGQ